MDALDVIKSRRSIRRYTDEAVAEEQIGKMVEAAMAAPKWELDNYTVIIDKNRIQNDTFVDEVMPIDPLADKWRAFNWKVVEIDGHDMHQVVNALEDAKNGNGAPTAIIAHTVKGKGVSFMENVPKWHGAAPNPEEREIALKEIAGVAE